MFSLLRNRYQKSRSLVPRSNLVTAMKRKRCFTKRFNSIELEQVEDVEGSTFSDRGDSQTKDGMLVAMLKMAFYFGQVPSCVSKNRKVRTHWANLIIFILLNIVTALHGFLQIRYFLLLSEEDENKKKEKLLMFSYTGFWILRCFLQFRQIQLLWCKKQLLSLVTRRLKASKLAEYMHPSWGKIFVIVLRSTSLILPLVSSILGLDLISEFRGWSLERLLEKRTDLLLLSILPSSYESPNTTAGYILDDVQFENILFGSMEMILEYCSEVSFGFSLDLLLISALTVWMCAREVRKELPENKIEVDQNVDDDDDALFEDGILNEAATKGLLKKHKALRLVSKNINHVVNNIQPSLALTSIFLISNFLAACIRQHWIRVLYYLPNLAKIVCIWYLSLDISSYKDDIVDWMNTETTQNVIGIDVAFLEIRAEDVTPVGVGSNIFHIDLGFVASLLGIFSAYFLFLLDFIYGNGAKCDCGGK